MVVYCEEIYLSVSSIVLRFWGVATTGNKRKKVYGIICIRRYETGVAMFH